MKKQIILIFAVLTLAICSCGKGEKMELETDLPATQSQILGTWMLEKNAYYYTYTFTLGQYELTMRNALDTENNYMRTETGTYEMEGNVMTLTAAEGTPLCPELTAYWADTNHYVLNLVPLGHFERVQ